jgi:hypothetical protein
MTTIRFKTVNGDNHMIDNGGNHFINNKCVNPLELESSVKSYQKCTKGLKVKYTDEIGSTVPTDETWVPFIEITGHVELVEVNGKMYPKNN